MEFETQARQGKRLSLRLLGPPGASLHGHPPLRFGRKKVLALLGYPTAEGWWHLRRELAELLGPDSGEPHARADLRATVSKLRKTREPNRAVGSRVVYVRDSPIVLAEGIHSAGADQKQVTAREADKELA